MRLIHLGSLGRRAQCAAERCTLRVAVDEANALEGSYFSQGATRGSTLSVLSGSPIDAGRRRLQAVSARPGMNAAGWRLFAAALDYLAPAP
jgi:hypothetical protein